MSRHATCACSLVLAVILCALTGCASKKETVQQHETKKRQQTSRPPRSQPRAQLAGFPGMMAAAAIAPAQGNLKLHFIDVGQGDSTLVECPNGDTILVDCGSTDEFEEDDVREYLRDQLGDDEHINLLVITHPDADHYNEVQNVLKARDDESAISVDRLMYVDNIASHGVANFDNWMQNFSGDKQRLTAGTYDVYPPQSIDICGDQVDVQVLAADVSSSFSTKNTESIVLLVRMGEFEAILTGDATYKTQRNIMDRFAGNEYLLEAAEVLKVGHHGSRYTSMVGRPTKKKSAWFDMVQPYVAIFSAAEDSRHGHPNADVAAALAGYTIEAESHPVKFWDKKYHPSSASTNNKYKKEAMFMTSKNGNIVITTDGETFEWELDQ